MGHPSNIVVALFYIESKLCISLSAKLGNGYSSSHLNVRKLSRRAVLDKSPICDILAKEIYW